MEKLKEKKKIKSKKNQERGITLIALVITIIVLIILAGVTIATITGDNGIIAQAMNAKNQTEIAGVKEGVLIDILEAEAESRNGITKEQFVKILGDYFMDVPTADELPEDLSTLILTTKDKYGEHKINISEIYNGDFSDTVVIAEKTIEDLVVGDKVYYDTGNISIGNQGIIECVVLYDKAYNEAKGTNYGIQIISSDVIKNSEGTAVTVPLGDNDNTVDGSDNFEKAKNSYNNALKRLYEEAQKYLNETYAISARCVGSDPADPDWDTTTNEAGYFTKTEGENRYYAYMKDYYGILKDTDDKYNTDWTQMGRITGIKPASDYYWVASRDVSSSSYGSTFDVRLVSTFGNLIIYDFCYVDSRGATSGGGNSYGFRPIFTLNSGIKITEGDGVDIPYTLTP